MALKTYNSSQVAGEVDEPIMPSLFDVKIFPPASLSALPIELLQQDIKSISGFDAFEKIPATVQQTFGTGKHRHYTGVQVDNMIELSITANVNLRGDDGTHATNLLTLKKMKDLAYNRATGQTGLTRDCVFKMVVTRHTKDDKIWMVATMEHCLFGEGGVTGLDEVNIETDEPVTLSFTVKSDKNYCETADSI